MSGSEYPFQMIGRVPVVTAPAEIDMTTSGALRAILVQCHSRGHATVLVDLTGAAFCDSAGLHELVRAHQRAAAGGGGLRLVIRADGAVARMLTLTGLDRAIPVFATVGQALAEVPGAAIGPQCQNTAREPGTARAGPPVRGGERGPLAGSRRCDQCGAVFVPVREHARFCSSDCRAAWTTGTRR